MSKKSPRVLQLYDHHGYYRYLQSSLELACGQSLSWFTPLFGVEKEAREVGMAWKVEFVMDDSGEWIGDPLRFRTEQEALAYARDLEFRCSAVREKRLLRCEEAINENFSSATARPLPRHEIRHH